MTTIGSMITKQRIIEQIGKGASKEIDFDGAHINHNDDLIQSEKCIVFTERAFAKINALTSEVINSRVQERGTIFFGRNVGDIIVVDRFESDLKLSKGIFESAAVDLTEKNYNEISVLTEKTKWNVTPYDVVMHFHVHPSYIQFRNEEGNIVIKDINQYGMLYSDQDLFTYGVLQSDFQPESNNKVTFLGGLVSANYGDSPTLSVVGYSEQNKDFFNYPELYRVENNRVIKIDRFNYKQSVNLVNDEESIIKVVSAVKSYKTYNNRMAII